MAKFNFPNSPSLNDEYTANSVVWKWNGHAWKRKSGVGAPTGPQGAQGHQGHQGVQGAQGAQGAQGHQGHQGHQGVQGAQGHQGHQGQTGAAGAQGAQGHQGIQGAQGHQGHQGKQGAQGHQGQTGAGGGAGSQGHQGVQGAQGHQGHQGQTGAGGGAGSQGHQGRQGAQGHQGHQGVQGAPGSPAGNAGTVTIRTETGNAYHNILFVDSSTDNQQQVVKMDNNSSIFAWNPDLNQLIANRCATSLMSTWGGSYGSSGQVLTSGGSGSSWAWQNVGSLAGGVPAGCILIWSGAANAIPTGWALCDGSGSTPDLRGRFVVGYHNNDNDYDVDDTGGNKSNTITINQLPSHQHTLGNHTHTFSGTTSGNGSHNHTYDKRSVTSVHSFGDSNQSRPQTNAFSGTTGTVGDHTHTFSGNTGTCNTATDQTGGNQSMENRPPYYALCYIMKT